VTKRVYNILVKDKHTSVRIVLLRPAHDYSDLGAATKQDL